MITRLKARADFVAMQDGQSVNSGSLVVRRLRQPNREDLRVGFTATKKLGNAVVRNRAKRRMRALASALLPTLGQTGYDYVFIARSGLVDRDWDKLVSDATSALLTLKRTNNVA